MTDVSSILSIEVLKFLSAKQETIADNIANANMPRYQAKKMDISNSFINLLKKDHLTKLPLNVTGNAHMKGDRAILKYRHKKNHFSRISDNGNDVSLKEEVIDMRSTKEDYNKAIKVYTSINGLISTVLGKNGF